MLGHHINTRIISLCMLGFASGLPLALTGPTLQAWFTESGISLVTIGALSLVGMPYIWKFLWAPLMDRYIPPFLGRRRGWIVISQLLLCLSLFWMAKTHPDTHPLLLGILALVTAFFSASQDIAIDAYRTDNLLPKELGVGLASFIFSYRIAMLFSGGIALVIADYFGWQITYEIMAIVMAVSALLTAISPEKQAVENKATSLYSTIKESIASLMQHKGIGYILIFIVLYKLGDALVVSLTSNFLLRGLGFSLTAVGFAYKTTGLVASILGAFLGGALLNRLGLYRGLFWFGLAQAFSNFSFMLLAFIGKNYLMMIFSVFIEAFCAGMTTIALFSLLTSLCDVRYSATQFACLSALASVGRVFIGPLAAVMVEHLGWVGFYGWASLLCFPAIIFLSFLRSKVRFHVEALI